MLLETFPWSALLVAQAQPSAEQTGNAVLIFVAVAVPIIAVIFGGLSLWIAARRQPPIAEEIYKKFLPRAEGAETIERIDNRIESAFAEISNVRNHADTEISVVRTQMSKAYGDFERALGRIEGKLDQPNRSRTPT